VPDRRTRLLPAPFSNALHGPFAWGPIPGAGLPVRQGAQRPVGPWKGSTRGGREAVRKGPPALPRTVLHRYCRRDRGPALSRLPGRVDREPAADRHRENGTATGRDGNQFRDRPVAANKQTASALSENSEGRASHAPTEKASRRPATSLPRWRHSTRPYRAREADKEGTGCMIGAVFWIIGV
jgi:hypothetical protein